MATAQDAVIRVEAASINPSDLKNVAGLMDWTVLPRTPGRDFAGVVVSGPPEWQGAAVWGTGGDTGFTRDGSHAEFISIPVEALVRKPERLSFDEASTVGVNFVVGWYGAVETAQLAAGETIAIFGVSGECGRCGRTDRSRGRRQGDRRGSPSARPRYARRVPSSITSSPSTLPPKSVLEIERLTGGTGVDVVYDAVGGVTTPAALKRARARAASSW